jgi:hypothetical protein
LHLEVFLGVLEELGWVNFGFLGGRGPEGFVIDWLDFGAVIVLEDGTKGVWDIPDIGWDTGVGAHFPGLAPFRGGGSF